MPHRNKTLRPGLPIRPRARRRAVSPVHQARAPFALPPARVVAETSPHVLYYFDLTTQTVLYANRRLTAHLDYTEAEAEHLPVTALAHPEDLPRIEAHFAAIGAIQDGGYAEIEYRMLHKDGGWRWFYCRDAVSARGADGVPIQIMGTVQDVTRRREAEIALQRVNAELSALISQAPLAIYALRDDGVVLTWNPAAARMFGWPAEEVIGRPLPVVPREDWARFLAQLRLAAHGGVSATVEERAVRRDGGAIDISISSAPLPHGDGARAVMIIAADVSAERRAQADLRRAMQQLALLAATDGLTGLSNHRAFQERLAQECARAERHQAAPALLMLDVDHFKQYNDAFGHPAGDAVLRRVADVLRRETRAEDMAARYGGEEFAILLPDVPAACAEDAAERVRTAVGGEHWDLRPITVSVGIGVWQPGLPPSALVKRADDALYLSKQRGRDRVTRWRG